MWGKTWETLSAASRVPLQGTGVPCFPVGALVAGPKFKRHWGPRRNGLEFQTTLELMCVPLVCHTCATRVPQRVPQRVPLEKPICLSTFMEFKELLDTIIEILLISVNVFKHTGFSSGTRCGTRRGTRAAHVWHTSGTRKREHPPQ